METSENKNQNPVTETPASPLRQFATVVWDLLVILFVVFIIIAPFRIFVAEPFVVSGSSMQPNYHDRDYLIIDRLTYRRHEPQRGDVIVLKYPKDTSQYFIKRIIGLPGEKVNFSQGHVIITNSEHPQGFQLDEPYLPNQQETIGRRDPVTLGSDEYFVLGDNRTASSDSRVWGILPADDIVGKVWARVFPVSRAMFEKSVDYQN